MTEDWYEGFDEAINVMHDFLLNTELYLKKCLRLSELMGMMENYSHTLSAQDNIKWMRNHLDQVRIEFLMLKWSKQL